MKKLIVILIGIMVLTSCEVEEVYPIEEIQEEILVEIPDSVDIYLLLYADLHKMTIGSSRFFRGGNQGVILYRKGDLDFLAYDRTCPKYPEHDTAVIAPGDDPDSGIWESLSCPECLSVYLQSDYGRPISGPAVDSLLSYETEILGDVLHIFNTPK